MLSLEEYISKRKKDGAVTNSHKIQAIKVTASFFSCIYAGTL